mmetsp:Transcript_55133/g.151785  ORF Transcript_55133/g.151785 Transcript_55133/m.151785 type:complete len:131 (+) Transcript_55133:227-619(+)
MPARPTYRASRSAPKLGLWRAALSRHTAHRTWDTAHTRTPRTPRTYRIPHIPHRTLHTPRFRQHDENEDGFLESDEFISLMSTDPQIRKYLSIDLNGYITDMTARDAVEKKSFGRKAFKDGIVNGWSTVF